MSSPTSWNLSPRSTAIRPSAQLRANRAITPHNSCSARPRRRRGTMTTIERDAATPPAWLRHVRSRTSPPDLTTIEGRLARVALILFALKRHRPGGPYAPSRYPCRRSKSLSYSCLWLGDLTPFGRRLSPRSRTYCLPSLVPVHISGTNLGSIALPALSFSGSLTH